MRFEDMISGTHKFYGVDNNCFKIGFHTFEAVENADDGYRSFMECINLKTDNELIFFRHSIANIRIEVLTENVKIYRFVDADDGHIWLAFGTDLHDEWYPVFVFEYNPKLPK